MQRTKTMNIILFALRNYKQLESRIANLMEDIDDLVEDVASISAIRYDKDRVQTSNLGNDTEDSAIRLIEKKEKLMQKLKEEEKKKRRLDVAVNNLDLIHKQVIQLHEIERKDWEEVSQLLNYSERQLREKRDEALQSITFEFEGFGFVEENEDNLFKRLRGE